MIEIAEIQSEKGVICSQILRALPRWFGIESAIVEYSKDVEAMPMLIAKTSKGLVLGFLSLKFHNEFNSEIHVMAVLPENHGKGIGSDLIKEAERYSRERGARFLTVKTLAPSRASREYDLTRKFYLSSGFLPLEEFKTLWGDTNPCLLMVKTI